MKRFILFGCLIALCVICLPHQATKAQLLPSFGKDRAGTSGFQFLKVPVDARSISLGGAVVANGADANSLFWNPALATATRKMQLSLNHTSYFAGTKMYALASIYTLGSWSLGASIQAFDAGDMDVTTEFQPFGTGETFGYSSVAAGLTVAQKLTDIFSYGVTAKYVREQTAGLTLQTVVFDIGAFYRVGNTGAQLAVVIRNFGLDGAFDGEITRETLDDPVTETDFETVTPPTTFMLGVAYEFFRENEQHELTVSGQLTNPNDNAENFNVGAEYVWHKLLTFRAGYRFGVDEYQLPGVGVGIFIPGIKPNLRFDYGFSIRERLGGVHRLTLNMSL